MEGLEDASDILQSVSHPLRMMIIESLGSQPESFSSIMLSCGLDPNYDSGLFYYHLSDLIKSGIVQKEGDVYRLTDFGLAVLRILGSVKSELSSSKKKEGKPEKSLKRPEKKVKIVQVDKPSLIISREDCELNLGQIYWGVSLRTVGSDKVCAVWPLSDGSIMYEMRDPREENGGSAMLHLTDEGLFALEDIFEYVKGGERTTLRFVTGGTKSLILPLPLAVGKKVEYRSQPLDLSTNAKVTGWKSIEGERKVKGEVVGQFNVEIDSKGFNCLLLREVIENSAIQTKEDGTREKRDPVLRVMMDRYLNENGRLRLEYLWYCEKGGSRSMSREEAKKKAGPIFEELTYDGTRWFRVIQVELDEPRYSRA